ncbi:MAG TPA: alpha/beta hydrolase [Bacteroidales bacterium]|nr:alpha/beta hydrolase [Bacteroidales bacterium]HOU31282.1 alpha/beta hydrolase [Bacteroidales bacterium]HPP91478.1 alpha/beta hydrolase [Bacteroidales bacterium]HRR17216.1 alpha/beta hydrolase [Bacteroidales bacterium]HRT48617.1 alpha/beta hydrolase [Bacteroidales bacterium]
MRLTVLILFLGFLFLNVNAQKKEVIYLWPGKVPGEQKEKLPPVISSPGADNVIRYEEVTNPLIEVYLPEASANKGAGVVVCPGGAYRILAYNKEGTEIAEWLNRLGYAAFVLQYRVPDKREGALQDAQRAIRIVRANASRWNIDPGKVGIMGFSAGGSLSARSATQFNRRTYTAVDKTDSLSCRPAFALLIYPAYLDQGPGNTLTPELTLTPETPPFFIFQTADDTYGNSAIVMTGALRMAKIPVELHVLPSGGHGYGLRPGKEAAETWPLLAEKWLKKITE